MLYFEQKQFPDKEPTRESKIIAEGNNLFVHWTLDENGIMTFTGFEAIGGWKAPEMRPWHSRSKYIREVRIGENISGIGSYAFSGCSNLRRVVFPDSLKIIGECAFRGCTGLDSVILPAGVKEIWAYAFSECSGLKDVVLPDGIEEIQGYAFAGCKSLAWITIPWDVMKIGMRIFERCSSLVQVKMPERWKRKGIYADVYHASRFSVERELRSFLESGLEMPEKRFHNSRSEDVVKYFWATSFDKYFGIPEYSVDFY